MRRDSSAIPHSSIAARARSSMFRVSRRGEKSWPQGCRLEKSDSGPKATFSLTVILSNSSMRWNVRPNPRLARVAGPRGFSDSSPSRTLPELALTRPVQALNVVVLPAPLGPIRPVIVPAGACSDTSSTATSPPKRTVTRSTVRSGMATFMSKPSPDARVRSGRGPDCLADPAPEPAQRSGSSPARARRRPRWPRFRTRLRRI